MDVQRPHSCTAFLGTTAISSGDLVEVAVQAKRAMDFTDDESLLIFDDLTSEQIEVDFRGTVDDVRARLAAVPPENRSDETQAVSRGRGRPKLGVVSREVTLLPRHWDWLNDQPGGASASLRRLVEQARRANRGQDEARHATEATYKFVSVMAGNFPQFEEAIRTLFAGDQDGFEKLVERWPLDIREHARKLSAPIWRGRVGKEED